MKDRLGTIKAILLKYLKQFKHDDEVNVKWLQRILEVNLNMTVPEPIIISYLEDKGYTHIVSSNNVKEDKDEKDRFTAKKDEPLQSSKSKDVNKEVDDDFDPNLFLKENKDLIESKVLNNYNYEDNIWLIESYSNTKNEATLFEIVTKNQGLVEKVAAHYANHAKHKLDFDDLVSIGKFGLMKAIEKFDPELGNQFSTYAIIWIRQAISRAIMDEGTTIRVPVHVHEQLMKLIKKENECVRDKDYLDINWVCEELDITLEKYHQLKRVDHSFLNLASLHSIVSNENEDSHLIDFIEYLPDHIIGAEISAFISPVEQMIILDRNKKIVDILSILTNREREVLKLRYGFCNGETHTLEEIGKLYGVTRERIRQVEAKALAKVKSRLHYEKFDFLDLVP